MVRPWNPEIDWKKNTMEWKMGKRTISVNGMQDLHSSIIVASIFQRSCTIKQISVQQMRKLEKNEAVSFAVVREMNEESRNEGIVTINEDQTQTPYPVEV